jgi:hypothetical protein
MSDIRRIRNIIDPFYERPVLDQKSDEELREIQNKMENRLYAFEHMHYDPDRVIPRLSQRYEAISQRERELARREQRVQERESQCGISPRSSRGSKRSISFSDGSSSQASTLRSTDYSSSSSVQPFSKVPDQVRAPDHVVRERLISDDFDELESVRLRNEEENELRLALELSKMEADQAEAHAYECEDEDDLVEKAYDDDSEDEARDEIKAVVKDEVRETVTIPTALNMSRFEDRPPNITPEFLESVRGLLKDQKFDEFMVRLKEVGTSAAWLVVLKHKGVTLRTRVARHDPDSHLCIEDRDV